MIPMMAALLPHESSPRYKPLLFKLGQPWRATPEPDFRNGTVAATWSSAGLKVAAQLCDDDVFSLATGHNQRMWELGDVFEIFLQLAGRTEYAELHVTPGNFCFHSHLPGVRGEIRPGGPRLPLEQLLVDPPGFESATELTEGGWGAEILIPPTVLGLGRWEDGVEVCVSFCRYDAARARPPVLSSSSPHPVPSFHRPHEWSRLRLVA